MDGDSYLEGYTQGRENSVRKRQGLICVVCPEPEVKEQRQTTNFSIPALYLSLDFYNRKDHYLRQVPLVITRLLKYFCINYYFLKINPEWGLSTSIFKINKEMLVQYGRKNMNFDQ